ncbi:MAG: HAD family hydrolase [Candidatus Eisenbacteria bacterium]|uniref:HAD family hydrolase n=1 Tax=Eiseniibacteriota bacterium TaxID=2212470 RepID=A0A538TFP1_UNCEI|nr:MAG: HAD family hydrolase [Candidatus Eisenbacteria bacterium]
MPFDPRLVWLFDIDGTLLHTDGAARQAFSAALHTRLGVADDLRDIAFAGRTDPLILADILRKHGRALPPDQVALFWQAACREMEGLLTPGRGRVLPGVEDLLSRIAAEPRWVRALLTGNTTAMARVKLGHFGLADRFAFGAFGEEAPDRNHLARLAVARAGASGVPPERCVVVGDTELDIECARAAGARAVAVATGVRRRHELEAHAPDLLLDDLTGADALLEWARVGARRD